MPIPRRQLDLGTDDQTEQLMRQIYALLQADREHAYSQEELRQQCNVPVEESSRSGRFVRALEALVWIGALGKALVHDQDYYAFGDEMDTNTWRPRVNV